MTPVKSDLVDAPYVQEFSLVLECRLAHTFELGLHTQFVGEILDVKAEEAVLGKGGLVDIKTMNPLVFTPDTQSYYGVGAFVGKAFSVARRFDEDGILPCAHLVQRDVNGGGAVQNGWTVSPPLHIGFC